jgi:protein-S-isoprenylcysteine O-methyltransferase Ste14
MLAVGSGLFGVWAVRTLGRQWSLVARLADQHELITTGPYAAVRDPIYTALFGLLLATGVARANSSRP